MFVYLIAFGGNTGNREQNAHGSLSQLQTFGQLGRQSRWTYTEPLRSPHFQTDDHGEYLNFVFEFQTELEPEALYSKICLIEDHFGHDRIQRWRPRAVDFDLLFYCKADSPVASFNIQASLSFRSQDGTFRIPHPEVWQRQFLLNMIETGLQLDIAELRRFLSAIGMERKK
ncbi:MAG: 2-amino-4-hydroxy-6-hydroxymethyldihydropteridine diphosphokinase [Silvanigrellaceae bacterium]